MTKRLEGRDEPRLLPELPIVDAHHHLFVRPGMTYLLDDYLADANAGHRIVASVYVETQAFVRPYGEELMRPVGEVEFANGIAAMTDSGLYGDVRVAAAIIGHADMRHGDDVARLLDRCIETAPERYRGVRQHLIEHASDAAFRFMPARPPSGILSSAAFRAAFRHLGPRGLLFEASVFSHQLPAIAALADDFPDTVISLNHMGPAMGIDLDPAERIELFEAWRRNLAELAKRPNVYCKVGGLGLPFWGFGLEARKEPIGYLELADIWRPYVATALDLFGADRCMAESDYPPDSRSCGFVPLWNALKHIVIGASEDDLSRFFSGTACRLYGVAMPDAPGLGEE